MIFGRKKKATTSTDDDVREESAEPVTDDTPGAADATGESADEAAEQDAAAKRAAEKDAVEKDAAEGTSEESDDDSDDAADDSDDAADDGHDSADDGDDSADDGEDWAAVDAEQDWRNDGPFDLEEVDLDADEVDRLDLGSLIVTPVDGMELRLQVNEETQQVMSAMVLLGESALELTVFAAPRSGGMWAEIREDIITATRELGGSADLARGPFGTELRRLMTVRTEDGQEAYQPSRTWVAEGPRWLLRGIVYGQAALADGVEPPADQMHDVFCNLVVRRGMDAKAPGDVVPLTLPEGAERE